MERLPELKIKGLKIPFPIIQGGMGVGVSLFPLASAVAREGGVGIVSSAGLDRIVSRRTNKKLTTYDAVLEELDLAKSKGGFAGINIMVALQRDYNDTVKAAIDAGADMIISGGGMPMNLPTIQNPGDTALIPIVSSPRALELICKKWERSGYRPDATVLEGPLAGGHLGFKFDEINLESNKLENLFPLVKEVAEKHGGFPVIVAGGIYGHEDIVRFIKMGASGVQMGTRFLTTKESSASAMFKQAVINTKEGDIQPTRLSPCGMPFMVVTGSPAVKIKKPFCDKGYVLFKDAEGKFTKCDAKDPNKDHVCICNALFGAINYSNPSYSLYTSGKIGEKVKKIISVKELMDELKEEK